MVRLRCLRAFACAAVLFSISCGLVWAQLSLPDRNVTRSVSGQFIVTGGGPLASLYAPLSIATNAASVRLKPALLAVSAERIKQTLWHDFGVSSQMPWRGKIFLVLHPARTLSENVTIVSEHFADGWNYKVSLPDVLSRTRFLRAMTGVVLLEFANRDAGTRSAEIPAWLTDGLAQQLLATGAVEMVLSAPIKSANGLLENQTDMTRRGVDPLANARRVLADHPALTFEQLSWPTEAQVSGADGGVYRASAQLFVDRLLKLKHGPAQLRTMLQLLPRYYNWQTAFHNAFLDDFALPLDVEKWWALQVVDFAAHTPGRTWTPAVSRIKLDQILSVPVDFRTVSNALPAHAEISLQTVIRNFDSTRQMAILQTKLRDLEIAQFRVARPLAVLTAEYRAAIADYLGESPRAKSPFRFGGRHTSARKVSKQQTLEKLDALDAQRRTVESSIKPDVLRP